eukprot:sb/3461863/
MVRLMEDNIWLGENPVLNNIILDLITRYKKVRVKLRGNQEHIIQSSLLAEQFLGTIEGVATWIVDMTAKISGPIPNDQEQLLERMSQFHSLHREVIAKESSIDTLIEKGAVLLAEGDVDMTHGSLIESRLSTVRDSYDEVVLLYSSHKSKLDAAVSTSTRYQLSLYPFPSSLPRYPLYSSRPPSLSLTLPQNKIDSVMGKLARFDTIYLGADKPRCDLDDIRDQVSRLEEAKSELTAIQTLITDLEASQVTDRSDVTFDRRKLQLRTKFDTVQAECESKIKSLLVQESKLNLIDADLLKLETWISVSCETLSSNLGENTALLDAVNNLSTEMNLEKEHFQVIKRNLEVFFKECKPLKQGAIIDRLQSVEESLVDIEDIVVERKMKCQDEMTQVNGFQEKMNKMFDWIHSKEQELASQSTNTLRHEEAVTQLADHETMQVDISNKQTTVDNINQTTNINRTTNVTNITSTNNTTNITSNTSNITTTDTTTTPGGESGVGAPDPSWDIPAYLKAGMTAAEYDLQQRVVQSKQVCEQRTQEMIQEKLVEMGVEEGHPEFESIKNQVTVESRKEVESLGVNPKTGGNAFQMQAVDRPISPVDRPISPVSLPPVEEHPEEEERQEEEKEEDHSDCPKCRLEALCRISPIPRVRAEEEELAARLASLHHTHPVPRICTCNDPNCSYRTRFQQGTTSRDHSTLLREHSILTSRDHQQEQRLRYSSPSKSPTPERFPTPERTLYLPAPVTTNIRKEDLLYKTGRDLEMINRRLSQIELESSRISPARFEPPSSYQTPSSNYQVPSTSYQLPPRSYQPPSFGLSRESSVGNTGYSSYRGSSGQHRSSLVSMGSGGNMGSSGMSRYTSSIGGRGSPHSNPSHHGHPLQSCWRVQPAICHDSRRYGKWAISRR